MITMSGNKTHDSDSDDDCFEDAIDDTKVTNLQSPATHTCESKTTDINVEKLGNEESNTVELFTECTDNIPMLQNAEEGSSKAADDAELEVLMKQDESDVSCSESDDDNAVIPRNIQEEQSVDDCDKVLDSPDLLDQDLPTMEEEKNNETPEIIIDDEVIRQKEALLTEEEREARRKSAQELKDEGNTEFKSSNFETAIDRFTSALTICPMCYAKDRSIFYSNRGACKYRLEKYEACIEDSSKALELNPLYMKALLRRAECLEKTEKLDEALEDYNKALEMDPSLRSAREACMRLPDQIKKRNEKLKEEMMGKLKDLGNMVLRPFGLSTNNFQMQQNESGGYSVNFVNSPDNGNKKS